MIHKKGKQLNRTKTNPSWLQILFYPSALPPFQSYYTFVKGLQLLSTCYLLNVYMNTKNSDHYFLRGGGEMGELIRAKDWSKTSLGDPADWPQSLRTMVAVMLDNPFGMYIAWGSEYTQLYNDGYRPILGASKHPQALGISTRETFSEIWHIIESMFDGVMKGKAVGFPDFMLPLNRNGFVEECYFDFSYSPIRKDNGEVGGVLVTVIETTNKKKAEEDLKESEARFRAIADDAPVFIFLAGENAEVEYLNKTWREYTGISTNDYKGRAWAEITHPDDVDPATKIYMDGFNKRESCSFENRQKGIDGIYRTILWKATPRFAVNGQFIGMMGVGLDIHERKKSEEKLRESEQRLRLANEASGVAVWEWNVITGQIKWDNEMFKIYGVTPTVDNLVDYTTWSTAVVPEELAQQENILQNTVKNKGQSSRSFNIIRASDGELRHLEAIEIVRTNAAGQAEWVVGTNLDVTEKMLATKKIEESEISHRQIFEFSPVAIWEKDDTALYQEIELLKQKGIKDFRKYLDKNPAEIFRLVSLVKLEDANNESVDLLQASSKEEVVTSFHKLFTEESIPMLKEGIIGVAENKKRLTIATVLQSLKGKRLEILISFDFRIGNDLNKSLVSLTDITEQVEARKKIEANEIQLRKTSEYLQIATNAAEVGIWSLDLASQKLDWSPLHKRMWGYDDQRTDLMYEDWHKVIFTEDTEAAFAEISRALKTKTLYEAVYRIKRPNDGEVRWMKSTGQYFYNEKDEPVMLTGVSIDITNDKIAEEKLLASEERFRLATKASGVGIWEWNVITNKIRWDAQMFRIYGVAPTADGFAEYSTWSNAVAPEDLSVQEKILQDTVKNIGTSNRSFKIYRANDGMLRFIDAIETVRVNAGGQAEWVVGTNLDVTEKVLARKEIEENEKQFTTLANNIQNLAWMADGEGYIFWYNQRWYDYTGTTLEEMKGWGWGKVHHPDHINRVVDFVKKAWHINEPFELTIPLRGVNGEYRWFLTRAYPVCDSEGKIINWIGTNTDITEQKTFAEQLEEQVKRRTAELVNMNKELQSFAYISSHDLQEPLRKIQTFATRITEKEENNLSDSGKEMFNRMQDAAKRMQTLIQDLLAYSRTTTTDHPFETIDLNKIVAEVKEDLKEELNEKHATIEANQLCDADIIPFQFRQLMHNLISNALKFSKPNHPPIIKISSEIANGIKFNNEKLSPQNKYCHITVSDNGIGFEEQYSEKIFEVFQRLHSKKEYEGTGIGLSIVKKIVENHNGIVTATGVLNKGATFDIYIPST